MKINLGPLARSNLVIASTFAVALALSLIPWPHWALAFKPDWAGLIVIYWVIALPNRVGLASAWFVGLMQDVFYGALLGQYALAKLIMALIALRFYLRIRVTPPWQQAIAVLGILLIGQLVVLWINHLLDKPSIGLAYWSPSLVGAVFWPWVFVILRDIRRRGQVR